MSSIKWDIANSNDRYWSMREKYKALVKAIKEQDQATTLRMVNEWEEFEAREEENTLKWVRSL